MFSKVKNHTRLSMVGLPLLFLVAATVNRTSLRSPATPPPSAANLSCPYQTPEEWNQFLSRVANNAKWVETCEDAPCDAHYYQFVKENIQATFERCSGFIERHPQIDRCTENFRKFTPSWMRQHDDDSYGFNIDNRTYLKDQESADRPKGMMVAPKEIIEALPSRAKVEEVARKNGWKYITHDSALKGIRTFVILSDPQGKFDTWLLLNLKAGNPKIEPNEPLSMLAVQKTDAEGNRLPQVRLHFRDYSISQDKGAYQVKLNAALNGKCYSCHMSGVRQLIARLTPTTFAKPVKGEPGYDEADTGPADPKFSLNRMLEFNRRLRSYGMPDWEGKITPENHGPALGQTQGCLDCHNGQTRGVLNVSLSHAQLEKKMYYELAMPTDTNLPRLLERNEMHNPELNPDEQTTLKQALVNHAEMTRDFEASRFPTLRDWLLETPCR